MAMNSSIGEILSNRGAFDGHSDWNESILESCGDEDENSVDPMPLKRESISLSKGVVSSLRKADAKRRGSLQHIDVNPEIYKSAKKHNSSAGGDAAKRKEEQKHAALFPWEYTGPNGKPLVDINSLNPLTLVNNRGATTPLLVRRPRRIRVSRIDGETPSVPPAPIPASMKKTITDAPNQAVQPAKTPQVTPEKSKTSLPATTSNFDPQSQTVKKQKTDMPDENLVSLLTLLSRPSIPELQRPTTQTHFAQQPLPEVLQRPQSSQTLTLARQFAASTPLIAKDFASTTGFEMLRSSHSASTLRVPVMNRPSTHQPPGFRPATSLVASRKIAGPHLQIPRRIQSQLKLGGGNWPLLTQDRLMVAYEMERKQIESQLKFEANLALLEEKKKTNALKKAEETRQKIRENTSRLLHGEPGESLLNSCEEGAEVSRKRHMKAKRYWNGAYEYALQEKALIIKPPALKARFQLRGLQALAGDVHLKKIYFAWADIQKAFGLKSCKLPLENSDAEKCTVTPRSDDPGKIVTVFRFKELLEGIGVPPGEAEQLVKQNPKFNVPVDGKLTYAMVHEAFWPGTQNRHNYDIELRKKIQWETEQEKMMEQRMVEYEMKLESKRKWAIDEMRESLAKIHPITKHSTLDYRKKKIMAHIMERNARKLARQSSARSENTEDTKPVLLEEDSDFEQTGLALMNIHIPLKSGVKKQLMEAAKFGLSLYGFSSIEASHFFQNYCALRIQATYRSKVCRRKAKEAEFLMRVNDMARRNRQRQLERLLVSAFNGWYTVINHQITLRAVCSRKFYLWKKFVVKKKLKEEIMLYCLWPIHIWRRYTQRKLVAYAKARTLKRIWGAYWLMRHLRGWRRAVVRRLRPAEAAHSLASGKTQIKASDCIMFWFDWASKKKRRRQIYLREGYKLRIRNIKAFKLRMFILWRWICYCRKQTKIRAYKYFRSNFILCEQRRQQLVKYRHTAAEEEDKKNGLHGIKEKDTEDDESMSSTTLNSKDKPKNIKKPKKKKKIKSKSTFEDKNAINIEILGGGIPVIPSLPGIELHDWSDRLTSDLVELCTTITNSYKDKEDYFMKENWLKYRRCAPLFMKRLFENVEENRKERFARVHAAKRLLKKTFNGFRDAVVDMMANEEVKFNKRKYKKQQKKITTQEDPKRQSLLARKLQKINNLMALGNKEMTQLERDRLRREQERETAKGQVTRITSLLERLRVGVVKEIKEDGKFMFIRQKDSEKLRTFMEKVANDTNLSDADAMKFAAEFQLYAAELLVDATYKVYQDYQEHCKRIVLRDCLKALRLPVISHKIKHLANVRKLRNWIRICKRFISFDRGMEYFRKLKTEWLVFNQLLFLLEEKYKCATLGLIQQAKVRTSKMLQLGVHLTTDAGLSGEHHRFEDLKAVSFTPKAIFLMWLHYVQQNFLWGKMTEAARHRHRLQFLQRAFYCLKMQLRPMSTWEMRKQNVPFGLKRCNTDLTVLRARMLAKYRLDPTKKIRSMSHKQMFSIRMDAFIGPSFKKFIRKFEATVRHRAAVEQRLLVEAFHTRGQLKFTDILLEEMMVGPSNLRNATSFKDLELPGAYLISEINVITRPSQGVVGYWMTAKGGDCTYNMKCHGVLAGKEEVFHLRTPRETLVQIEFIYSSVLEKMRFITSTGRVSPWYGERVSAQPNHSLVPPHPQRGQYITGTFGYETNLRILAMGVITRQVIKADLFSYYWAEPFHGDGSHPHGSKQSPRLVDNSAITTTGMDLGSSTIELTNLGQSSHEMEFAAVIRMRISDVYSSMYRAIAFARRIWGDPGINLRWDLNSLCRLRIIKSLTRWFFESICWRLVPFVEKTEEIESLIEEGREKVLQGRHMQSTAAMYKRRAEYMLQQPVTWKRSGLLSPEDRKQEKEFKDFIADLVDKAEATEQEGQILIDQGQYMSEKALSRLPQLDKSPENLAYYFEKLSTAKTQLQLETSLGQNAFREGLKTIGGGTLGALNEQIVDTVTRALRKKMIDEAKLKAEASFIDEYPP